MNIASISERQILDLTPKGIKIGLTNAELLALNTTALTVIPGEIGRIIRPVYFHFRKNPGTAYTLGAATHFKLKWVDSSGTECGSITVSGLLDTTAEKRGFFDGMGGAAGGYNNFTTALTTTIIGAKVVLHMAGGNVSVGTGSGEATIYYISLPGNSW